MGAIKDNNYTFEELEIATICDALSHPARKRIVDILRENRSIRNIDLTKILNLSSPSVMNHLIKLKNAQLIHVRYQMHYYDVYLNENALFKLANYLSK